MKKCDLTLLWLKSLSYRNQSIDLREWTGFYMIGTSFIKELNLSFTPENNLKSLLAAPNFHSFAGNNLTTYIEIVKFWIREVDIPQSHIHWLYPNFAFNIRLFN